MNRHEKEEKEKTRKKKSGRCHILNDFVAFAVRRDTGAPAPARERHVYYKHVIKQLVEMLVDRIRQSTGWTRSGTVPNNVRSLIVALVASRSSSVRRERRR